MKKGMRILAVLLTLTLLSVPLQCSFPSKADLSSTKEQLDKAKQEKDNLEAEQKQNEKNLGKLKNEKSSLQKEVKNLNEQLEAVSDHLAELEQQIADKQQEIEDSRVALENAIATEEWQYASMVLRVRCMYEQYDTSYLNALLTAGSLGELVNVADYFERIEEYDQQKLAEFKDNRAYIETEKARLEQEEGELQALKTEAEEEQEKVSTLIASTQKSITSFSSQISDVEADMAETEKELAETEAQIAELKKKYEEELAMSRKAANSTWRDISEVTFEESDRYLLANLIYCEAGSEPYEGKLAVGAVVINRVLSSVYPDTVTGVIYQKKQFSPAGSGRLALALANGKATQACYQAADEAMSGVTNVGSCVYFRTPIPGLTGISIGNHIFY